MFRKSYITSSPFLHEVHWLFFNFFENKYGLSDLKEIQIENDMYCTNVCSGHFEQDNDVDFVDSQIRRSKDGVFRSLLLWSTRSNLKDKKNCGT